METDGLDEEERGLARSEPMGVREEPLGCVNGIPEADNKENNRTTAEEPLAVRYNTPTHGIPLPNALDTMI